MPVPITYRKGAESSIASYDFYDLSTGTGYKSFYGLQVIEVGTAKNVLVTNAMETYETYTGGTNANLDIDFDLTIAVPTKLKGDAIMNIPITGFVSSGSADVTTTIGISLFKVVGVTETLIGSAVSKEITFVGAGTTESWKVLSGKIAVPITNFKAGEVIRLNVTSSAPGVNKSVRIYHDPKERDATATLKSTDLLLNLPFRIDI